MSKILIGVDGSERSEDALAFGRSLALAADAPVILAMAHRLEPLRPGAEEHEAFLRQDAERTLARLAVELEDVSDVALRPLVANTSPAHALQATAEAEQAGIIVVGSSHTGRLGRVLPGSTAERLLHGAPCPVAVVPLGYRTHAARSRPVWLRIPLDRGRRGCSRGRRGTRPCPVRSTASDAGHRTACADIRRR
jgi:nucleotide-binding universal stress UspA family protein